MSREQYDAIGAGAQQVRTFVEKVWAASPEVFPEAMSGGYRLTGRLPESKKLPDVRLRQNQALGVLEVWLWEDGIFTLHRLGENGYTRIYRSQIVEMERLDIELLSRCVLIGETDWLGAVRTFREAIAGDGPAPLTIAR